MGGWPELDARYDQGTLTPAMAFVVSLTYMAGADGVYLAEEEGSLAAFLPKNGLGGIRYDDLLMCADEYLKTASLEQFLTEASAVLTDEQKLCILVNMIDSALADGVAAPEEQALFKQFLQAFGIADEYVRPYLRGIFVKHNLAIFMP